MVPGKYGSSRVIHLFCCEAGKRYLDMSWDLWKENVSIVTESLFVLLMESLLARTESVLIG